MGVGKPIDRTDRTLGEHAKPSRIGSAAMGCPSPSILVWSSLCPREQHDVGRAVSMTPQGQSVAAETKGTR